MTHTEIRQKFLDFFKKKNHTIIPSSSLLPTDPSVLFTTAGMQQFKPYYTNQADAIKDFNSLNTVSIQKCVRTSDIDEVGDESHLTFFEMLGNFSFGGYFKKEAIQWGYEFITKEMGLKIDYVSIFGGEKNLPADTESEKVWKLIVPDIIIKKFGRADNFWGPTGDEGPCGPTSEIYVNGVEIWNLVFNQYYQNKSGELESLKTPGIDTGMGLERLAMMVQEKRSIFETDLFSLLIRTIKEKIAKPLDGERSYRIIADHVRSSIFLISDGLTPSNKEQGYVLRRLIRRAILHAFDITLKAGDYRFDYILDEAINIYAPIYEELAGNKNDIHNKFMDEALKFLKTIQQGYKIYGAFGKAISGQQAFLLFSSYGFPIEVTEELAKRDEKTVDRAGYDLELEKHKEQSRAGAEKKFGGHGIIKGDLTAGSEKEMAVKIKLHTATHLLHAALRNILGDEVKQAGSDITAERLRFDFALPRKMKPGEVKKVEEIVNEIIKKDLKVTKTEMPYDEAIKTGALSFFKLKYPSVVSVYSIGDFSKELCGGPHVSHTGEIGKFKITKEESVSAGVRRIRAIIE